MGPTSDSPVGSSVFTVVMHHLSVGILSFCLARRSFFRIGPKQMHPAIRRSQIARFSDLESAGVAVDPRRPSAGTIDTRLKPIGWICRIWRDLTVSNYVPHTTCTRLMTFLTLVTSLIFAIFSSILVSGMGLNSKPVVSLAQGGDRGVAEVSTRGPTLGCHAAIYLCICFYGLTKVCVYLVLIERVYIVSCYGTTVPRLSTTIYKAGILGIVIYIGLITLLVLTRIVGVTPSTTPLAAYFIPPSLDGDNDALGRVTIGICTIGLGLYGTIPFIIYETAVSVVLTAMFVVPIASSGRHGYKRRLCRRPSIPFTRNLQPFAKPSITRPHSPTPGGIPPSNLAPPPSPPSTHSRPDSWRFELEDQGMSSTELQRLAKRSLLVSSVGLISFLVNISVIIFRNGREEGSLLMRWCLADVVINALGVFMVMQKGDEWLWRSVDDGKRPNVTLPRGIWSETDHGVGVDSSFFTGNGVSLTRRETENRRKRTTVFPEDYSMASSIARLSPAVVRPTTGNTVSTLSPSFSPLSPLTSLLIRAQGAHRNTACVSPRLESRRPSSVTQVELSSSASSDSFMKREGSREGRDHCGATSTSIGGSNKCSSHAEPKPATNVAPLKSRVSLPTFNSAPCTPPREIYPPPANELNPNEANRFLGGTIRRGQRRWSSVAAPSRFLAP